MGKTGRLQNWDGGLVSCVIVPQTSERLVLLTRSVGHLHLLEFVMELFKFPHRPMPWCDWSKAHTGNGTSSCVIKDHNWIGCSISRLVRMSPFDSKGKRHTSFATVVVFPTQRDAEKASSTYYWTSNDEIRIETMRSSGPGGQHVNTTDSCVRITHLASGESVQVRVHERMHFLIPVTSMNRYKADHSIKTRFADCVQSPVSVFLR